MDPMGSKSHPRDVEKESVCFVGLKNGPWKESVLLPAQKGSETQ